MSTPADDQPTRSTPPADPAPRPTRRAFTPEYKLAIVTEYENAPNGEKGAILRREGLYSSHVIEWTRARDAGALTTGPTDPAAPARRPKKTAEQIELDKLRRRNAQLEADLTKTRLALDIMGKAHALLEELSESADTDEPPTTS
ncbi:transposase [Kutzneria sp. 744]|uniref:transposase n=1 Tax=Kutzneria sp. (strain 744) TaxID=345341 RepID=UPI0005BE1C76